MGASERQLLEEKSPWWGEHVHRYEVAKTYLEPTDRVLDIACGTGFGTSLVAEAVPSGEVIGGDVVEEVLAENRSRFADQANISFAYTDATALAYPDDHFDAVFSFETLEHVEADEKMLQELRRVLKPTGVLVLSTPNFPINSPSGKVTNPFHVREYTLAQFAPLMKATFPAVAIYGQEYSRYTAGGSSGFARGLENLLYQRGFRKLPLGVQDGLMKTVGGTPMYPRPSDYRLVSDRAAIVQCKTFVAIWDGRPQATDSQ